MTGTMPTIPPCPTDVSQPFWDACRDHRLTMQRCADCGDFTFYPVYLCPTCGGGGLDWTPVGGRGRVHSLTHVHRPSAPVFAGAVPYVVALIQLAEGPIMMSNLVGPKAMEARIGDAVEVVFEEVGEVTLPRFRPVGAGPLGG